MSFSSWGNALYSGRKSYNFIGNRKYLLIAGAILMAISVLAMSVLGLERSIDFKGGTEFTVSSVSGADQGPAQNVVNANPKLKGSTVNSVGASSVRVQSVSLDTNDKRQVVTDLAKAYSVSEAKVAATTIGPSWGADVTYKALQSLIIFFLLVSLMLWAYFRTWTMAVSALFALCHDVLITGLVLALTRVEISPATIIGVLTILGYSLYDTVVVFDKVRELSVDFEQQTRSTYGELVNLAINQTLVRSINTSVVALLPVTSILLISWVALGGGTLRDISLALFVGMIAGTLSSILIAPSLLIVLRSRSTKIAAHTQKVLDKRANGSDMDAEDAKDAIRVAHPLKAGHHQGQQAQPKRTARSKR